MAFEAKSFFGESRFPVQTETNAGCVVQQAGLFFLAGELGELRVKWMVGREVS